MTARTAELAGRPVLGGIGPCQALYESVWEQAAAKLEHDRAQLLAELDRLLEMLAEWRPTHAELNPRTLHRGSLWKCRAGTAVPLCWSLAPHRPDAPAILLPSWVGVDCPECLAVNSSSLTG
jgi:hypothetical protein